MQKNHELSQGEQKNTNLHQIFISAVLKYHFWRSPTPVLVVGPARYGQLLRKGTVVKPMVDDDDDVPGPFFSTGFP